MASFKEYNSKCLKWMISPIYYENHKDLCKAIVKALHNYIFILADLLYMYTRNFTFSFKNGFLQVQFPSPPHPVLEARQSLELCRPWFFSLLLVFYWILIKNFFKSLYSFHLLAPCSEFCLFSLVNVINSKR